MYLLHNKRNFISFVYRSAMSEEYEKILGKQ